ncbi:MAG TPA: AMP-binding protein [Candidatus Saccharimonadales bacterium]|jgi:long-chain acyl-CoA synthetase|nr:AMP-binding protein [Candidatus Saccharimonadales bacterium]
MNTLADLAQQYLKFPKDTAFASRRGYRTLRWSYRQTAELAFRFARELEARGIGKADRVLLWGDNGPEWVAAFAGIMLRGAVAVPMDRIASPDFMQRVTDDVQAKLVLCSTALVEACGKWPHLELEEMSSTLARHSSAAYPAAALTGGDTAQIVFTSGTTAEPRGVVLTHGNLMASLGPIAREIPKYLKYERIFHPIRFLHLLPLSHVFGQYMGMFVPPLIGGTVIFQESFNPREVIEAIRANRVSVLVAVPRAMESVKQKLERDFPGEFGEKFDDAENERFLRRWWRFRKIHRQFGWKFWAAISGGAALDSGTEEFWRRLGYVVIQGYGLTETSSLISLNHPFKVGRRSIGKVLPGREMKLDPESGEILVRGANVAQQYWQGKELKPVTGEEGWFRTGDLGALDEEGNLYFKGRNKNVIVTPGGLKIYPEDLEQALRRQPEVQDCVVFSVAQGGNAEACAVLLLRNGAGEAVVARANTALADFQKIRSFFVWPDEDFPRTSTQKPKLAAIRATVEAQLGQPAAAAAASSTMQELIQSVLRRRAEVPQGARLEDNLNLSSLDRVELMSALEDRYQIDLSDREFSQVTTIAELEELVKNSSAPVARLDYPYSPWAQRWPMTWIRTTVYYTLVWTYTMIMARPKIIGRENLAGLKGPALVICNHVAQIDVGFILAALPVRFRHRLAPAMQGETLRSMRHPPKEWSFRRRWYEQLQYMLVTALFNVFPLPQKAGYRESFRYAGQLADHGYNVLVFPEGLRTETGEMAEFRKGIGLLATRLNLPVIPMRIDGMFPFKRDKKHYAPPGAIQVRIGTPVTFSPDANPEEIAQELQRKVQGL